MSAFALGQECGFVNGDGWTLTDAWRDLVGDDPRRG